MLIPTIPFQMTEIEGYEGTHPNPWPHPGTAHMLTPLWYASLLNNSLSRLYQRSLPPTNQYLDSGTVPYIYLSKRNQQRKASSINNEKNETTKKKGVFGILKNHATEISTAHGFPLIFRSKRWYGKLFWTLILLAAFGAFGRQSYYLLKRYIDAPVSVEVS